MGVYAILKNDIMQSCPDRHDGSCICFLTFTSAFIQSMCMALAFSWSWGFIICMDCMSWDGIKHGLCTDAAAAADPTIRIANDKNSEKACF